MTRIFLAVACAAAASACATTAVSSASPTPHNRGMVTVAGLAPDEALGAVDTAKLVGAKPLDVTSNQATNKGEEPDSATTNAINVGGLAPAAVLAAIDPTKLVTPKKSPG